MAEYINRGTAIAKLTALEVTEPNATMADAKRVLADIPAADVAPVVRCKDCVYGHRCTLGLLECRMLGIMTNKDCYCWMGNRKEAT